jgi:hypothetical protein
MKTATFFSTILAILIPVLVQAQCITLSFQTSDYNGSQISCHGANDGAVFVNAIGANRFMTYQWSNGQTDAQAQNLSAGTYNVTVSDNTGCVVTGSVQKSIIIIRKYVQLKKGSIDRQGAKHIEKDQD